MAPQPYQAYAQLQAATASQAELMVLLYRGAVRFAAKARIHLESGELEATHNCLVRAQQIMVELMIGIRPSQEQISHDLYVLHHYIYRVLYDANMRKDTALIDEATRHLRPLLETWEEIALPKSTPPTRAGVVSFDRRC